MTNSPIDRRIFVASGVALGCFANMSREAFAQARAISRQTGRPLLSTETLNRMIPPPSSPTHTQFLRDAASDLPTFVRTHFALTPDQESELDSVPPSDFVALQALIRRAADNNQSIVFTPIAAAESTGDARQTEHRDNNRSKWTAKLGGVARDGADRAENASQVIIRVRANAAVLRAPSGASRHQH